LLKLEKIEQSLKLNSLQFKNKLPKKQKNKFNYLIYLNKKKLTFLKKNKLTFLTNQNKFLKFSRFKKRNFFQNFNLFLNLIKKSKIKYKIKKKEKKLLKKNKVFQRLNLQKLNFEQKIKKKYFSLFLNFKDNLELKYNSKN
jgi:hypothetical protein